MKIVRLKGGLGNQMFQYAFARALREKTGDEVCLDYSSYGNLKNDSVRVPRIKKMNITIPDAKPEDIHKICFFPHGFNSQSNIYRASVLAEKALNPKYFFEPARSFIDISSIEKKSYFDGYWQCPRYFKDFETELRKEFTPKEKISASASAAIERVKKENAVFIGIRRGDYAADKKMVSHYGTFETDYYDTAMHYIFERVDSPVFYIFSNDIEWVKSNMLFGDEFDVRYRDLTDTTDDFEELLLMSACKHAIIPNSTFYYWGAWLEEGTNDPLKKIVVAPKNWFADGSPSDIVPDEWVKM